MNLQQFRIAKTFDFYYANVRPKNIVLFGFLSLITISMSSCMIAKKREKYDIYFHLTFMNIWSNLLLTSLIIFVDFVISAPLNKMIFQPIFLLILMYSTCARCILPSKNMAYFCSLLWYVLKYDNFKMSLGS